jgi:hypothetical protein
MTWSICLLNIFIVLREENVLNRLRTINICTIDYKIELSMDYPSTRNSMINLIKTQWNTNNSVQHVFSPLKIRFYILRLLLKAREVYHLAWECHMDKRALSSCVRMSYGQESFIILRENVIWTRELYHLTWECHMDKRALLSCVRMSYGQESFIILRENVIWTREVYHLAWECHIDKRALSSCVRMSYIQESFIKLCMMSGRPGMKMENSIDENIC